MSERLSKNGFIGASDPADVSKDSTRPTWYTKSSLPTSRQASIQSAAFVRTPT